MPCVAANSGRRTGATIATRQRTATMMDILFHGVGWTDIALTLNRIAVGMFFMLSGYHKLYAFMLIMVVSAGAGPYSLDALIWGLIDKHGA
jgi:hypothetical protein